MLVEGCLQFLHVSFKVIHQNVEAFMCSVTSAAGENERLYLCTHTGCRADAGVDGSNIEIWVRCRVIRQIVDSVILLEDHVGLLTQNPPQDVQA